MYFGDSLVKDGGMAQRAGILFGLFGSELDSEMTNNGMAFSDWRIAEKFLKENSELFDGRDLGQILFGNPSEIEGQIPSLRERGN